MNSERGRPGLFRTVERARHHVTHHMAAVASSLGMTEPEAHLLAHLATRPPTAIAHLQRAFGLPPSTLTNVLDRMEGRGLLAREVNPTDRRSFVVVLTPSGRRRAAKTLELISQLEASITAKVSKIELDGFFAVLDTIERGLEPYGDQHGGKQHGKG